MLFRSEGRVATLMTTLPLDTDDLFSVLDDAATEPFDGLPAGTVMGHVHLRVAEIPATVDFYRGLGFELMAEYGRQAAFLAAGGYHHHLGANTWESAGAPQPPPGYAGLRHATMILPDAAERDRVLEAAGADGPELVDPSGNRWAVEAADA